MLSYYQTQYLGISDPIATKIWGICQKVPKAYIEIMKKNNWYVKYDCKDVTIWIYGKENIIFRSSFSKLPVKNFEHKKFNKTEIKNIKIMLEKNCFAFGKFKTKIVGTDFQKKVWRAIVKIPFGKTISYKTLAEKINKPKTVRAVANACGANPLPLFIPCHRVISSNGTIGGFNAGIKLKRKLLKNEQINLPIHRPIDQ